MHGFTLRTTALALLLLMITAPLTSWAQTVLFSENFNRANGTLIGNGWTEQSLATNESTLNLYDIVSIVDGRLRVTHNLPGRNVDAGISRPFPNVCGVVVSGTVDWMNNPAAGVAVYLNATTRLADPQGLFIILAPALSGAHYIYFYNENVLTRAPVPFTFDVTALYKFEWAVRSDCSTEVRVWKVAQARPGAPTASSPAVAIVPRSNPSLVVKAVGGAGCCTYPGYDVRIDDFLVTQFVGPGADAGANQSVSEGAGVMLNGSASRGEGITYSWTQLAGPPVNLVGSNAPSPTFVAPLLNGGFGSQTLSFQLTVSDGIQSSTAVTNVVVVNVNHAPVADAGTNASVMEGALVTLSASNSYDPDLDPITYTWTQISGPPVQLSSTNGASLSFSAPIIGGGQNNYADLIFAVTVSDGALSHASPVTVRVERVNHPPVASAGNNATVRPGSVVTLSGTAQDPDGDPLQVTWAQVAGPAVALNAASTLAPSFVAPQTDATIQLRFRLMVSDGLLSSNASEMVVTVVNNKPVCAAAYANPAEMWPPNHSLVPVKIMGVTDPENDQILVNVTGVMQDEPTNGTGAGDTSPDAVIDGSKVLLRAERSGTGNGRIYIVAFAATDSSGGSCTGTVKVSVPKNKSNAGPAVDSGSRFDSTLN